MDFIRRTSKFVFLVLSLIGIGGVPDDLRTLWGWLTDIWDVLRLASTDVDWTPKYPWLLWTAFSLLGVRHHRSVVVASRSLVLGPYVWT